MNYAAPLAIKGIRSGGKQGDTQRDSRKECPVIEDAELNREVVLVVVTE